MILIFNDFLKAYEEQLNFLNPEKHINMTEEEPKNLRKRKTEIEKVALQNSSLGYSSIYLMIGVILIIFCLQ